jgi:hypothetical protein
VVYFGMIAMPLQQSDSLDPRDARIAALERLVAYQNLVLSDRLEKLEHIHGISTDDGVRWLTVKAAAAESGFSESGIRKLIRESRVTYEWRGGKVYVSDVPKYK